ncbi:MAG: adenosylcobinamide-GDP ribazoletransferase [Eubacteriales bacterium]|nr:adenosylcobinamide-GDP ribazoletransferase [Eubacteriales bacterium]
MKSVWNSCKAAFAMFSKIPVPMVDWNKENMKYMMCFFPFVGAVIGVLTWLTGCVLGNHVKLEPFFLTVLLTVIPVVVTGGIHVDGLLDTSDALSSWQERTRRLEILKDSHAGAFAVITACIYFILWLGAWSQLQNNPKGICIMSMGYMMSRCLSGIGVITFPKAKSDGTVAEFSRNASEITARNILMVMFVILVALMLWVSPVMGVLAVLSALLVFWWYHHMAMKYFGGTTGDLSGFFLCICEVVMALVLALAGAVIL